ncbi:transcription factor HES-1-B isoform X2 [Esox lucius]|uniref:transcription factor HES-1-B isoform X2 n=1 Tax=Esox lucius TaxID=8010 RepID=UPI001477571C|nr:transcription factor HES-1-B isoform X2 [Esox lucius]
MPADILENTSSASVVSTPSRANGNPDKPKTASEHRKSSKPIMEKRRRARINDSLGQLKTLILDALKKDSSRHSKLEKADILEMTVKHLRNMQRLQITGVNTDVRSQLLSHLASCVSQINTMSFSTQRQISTYCQRPAPVQSISPTPAASPQLNGVMSCKSGSPLNFSSEFAKLYSGLQIVPATDGQFAFLIPSSALAHINAPNAQHGNPGLAVAVSPVLAPITADSVWRPW